MAIEIPIDVDLLKREIKKTYASLSREPEKDFVFPTGRAWADDLGYPPELANVPERAAESFAGVANPFSLGRLEAGERVWPISVVARVRTHSSPLRWSGPTATSPGST